LERRRAVLLAPCLNSLESNIVIPDHRINSNPTRFQSNYMLAGGVQEAVSESPIMFTLLYPQRFMLRWFLVCYHNE
jgi:hypothetical protein